MNDLKNPRQPIYQAVNEENALENLLKFEEKWGKKYPYAVKVWQNNWDGIKIIMDNAPIPNWSLIFNQFLIYFNERLEKIL